MRKFIKSFFDYSISNFANDIIRAIRHHGYTGDIHWNEQENRIVMGPVGSWNLQNVYQENKHLKREELLAFVDTLVEEMLHEPTLNWDEIHENLVDKMQRLNDIMNQYISKLP